MEDLSGHVANPELVVAKLGSWPSLHDAEVLSLELRRYGEGNPSATIALETNPYDPNGRAKKAQMTIVFRGVDDVSFADFNHQNVIWSLKVEHYDQRKKLVVSSSYGLSGGFVFEEAEVLQAEFLD